jgi:transcriptional regulator PpsR
LTINIGQPDITLLLDLDGVIQEATLSPMLSDEAVQSWLGKSWTDTVDDAVSEKVERIMADARSTGVSAFRQITQRLPSGLEVPMEYTTVLLGGRAGLLAIGKSLQAVAELQSKLITAQQTMERDYWKLREVETKYRLLFDASHEPALILNATTLRITEANPAAINAIGADRETAIGRGFLNDVAASDRAAFQAMLGRVREQGKAPAILLHLGKANGAWLARGSLMSPDPTPVMLLQLVPAASAQSATPQPEIISTDDLIERLPDAFVVIDRNGIVRRANRVFLDLVEVNTKSSVIGERLTRWLSRPGADLSVLLANVERHRFVRLFTTAIQGELGTQTDVEISAAGSTDNDPSHLGVLIRDIGRRIGRSAEDGNLRTELGAVAERIGKTPLRKLVKETIALVERHYVHSALGLANGNRTVTAELLGLSRQSLYAKLNRYGLSNGAEDNNEG